MEANKFLLVCEGPTDIMILKEITSALAQKYGEKAEIIEMSPQLDATSGSYPPHGWAEVRSWCKRYGTKKQEEIDKMEEWAKKMLEKSNWRAFLAINNAKALIIQLDTDIVEEINDLNTSFTASTLTRKQYANDAIMNWLGENSMPNNLYFVLSTYSSETWLLAVHDRADKVFEDLKSNFNYEEINDVEQRLIKLGYNKKTIGSKEKLSKAKKHYKNHVQKIAENLEKIKVDVSEAKNYCDFIKSKF